MEIIDAANYFLLKEKMNGKKLHGLIYLSFAFYYADTKDFIFKEKIFKAYIHGPRNEKLLNKYRASYEDIILSNEDRQDINLKKLNKEKIEFLDTIYEEFNYMDGFSFESYFLQKDYSFKNARKDLAILSNTKNEINYDDIYDFYNFLQTDNAKFL